MRRKAPQFKWICMDRPNERNLLVQMDDGPMDRLYYINLDRPNGRRSKGPPMLRKFGLSNGPMERLYYVNLERPSGRRSNGPSMLRQFGPPILR